MGTGSALYSSARENCRHWVVSEARRGKWGSESVVTAIRKAHQIDQIRTILTTRFVSLTFVVYPPSASASSPK